MTQNLRNIRIELPQEVINKLELVIIKTATKPFMHIENIKEELKNVHTQKSGINTTHYSTLPLEISCFNANRIL